MCRKSSRVVSKPMKASISKTEAARVVIFFGYFFRRMYRVAIMAIWILNNNRKVFQPERRILYSLCMVAIPTRPIRDILEIR